MRFVNIWKPWYIFRPRQLAMRLARAIRPCTEPIQVVTLPWGCRLRIDVRETLGISIWTTGIYDLAVSEALIRLVSEGDLAIDAGANIGYMTSLLGVKAGSTGEVWSFEPHPIIGQVLASNIDMFAHSGLFARPKVFNGALSESNGNAQLVCPTDFDQNNGLASIGAASGNGAITFDVTTWRLDAMVGDREVGVLKVDVEGHELKVFSGAADLLRRHRIKHIVYEDHSGSESDVHKLLKSFGYTVGQIGWTMRGPVLASLAGPCVHRHYEAPSYCATLDWNLAEACFRPRGWNVFRVSREKSASIA